MLHGSVQKIYGSNKCFWYHHLHIWIAALILPFLWTVLAKSLMFHVNIDENSETLLLLSGLPHGCCSSGRIQSAKHRLKVHTTFYDKNAGSAVFLEWTWAQPTAQEEGSTKSPLGGSFRKWVLHAAQYCFRKWVLHAAQYCFHFSPLTLDFECINKFYADKTLPVFQHHTLESFQIHFLRSNNVYKIYQAKMFAPRFVALAQICMSPLTKQVTLCCAFVTSVLALALCGQCLLLRLRVTSMHK